VDEALEAEVNEHAQLLADAARAYISVRTDGAGEVLRIARKWSPGGWQAVARAQGLEFVPWGEEMLRALAILEGAVGDNLGD
jgi:hypothetical protein